MIRVENKKQGISLSDPKNLEPIVFKCKDCGCTIRKLLETNSYVLMSVSKEVYNKEIEFCKFCSRLNEFRGICN